MDYQQLFPSSRDEQFTMAKDLFTALGFAGLRLMTLFAAGMGSGKSNLMAALPKAVALNGITYVLSPNDRIGKQLEKVFRRVMKWGLMVIVDGNDPYSFEKIRVAANKPVVVFFHCLRKVNASTMNPTTRNFLKHLAEFKAEQQLVLIDELDLHLTELTGGINSKVSHHQDILTGPHKALMEFQADSSLNIFDFIRTAGAKCVGFSGTFNNTICSKLPSMGYQAHEISLVNMAPIRSLYWNEDGTPRTTIIHANITVKKNGKRVPNESVLFSFFERVKASDGKGLIACSTQKQIDTVKRMYHAKYGTEIECASITGDSKPTDLEIANADFVIGMKLVGTGLDLSTLAEGCQFSHGILLSNLSDKESNPLSKNLDHFLHMEVSSSFLQLIARLREGGTFVVPKAFDAVTSLGAALQKVFEIIGDGRAEMRIVGPIRADQHGRYYQGILLAIVQNLRHGMENMYEEERPVVERILTDLALFDGRSIKAEYYAYKEGATFDHEYWIKAIELLWSVYLERFEKSMKKEVFQAKKGEMIAAAKVRGPRVVQRGNGVREGHEHDERVAELVRARAQGICCHCGDPLLPDESQVCHVERKDQKGPFTLENILHGHIDCDASFDANRIIHAPSGGTYRDKKRINHEPDMKQWSGISLDHIEKRWKWAMTKMGYSDPEEFKAGLLASGYRFFPA